MLKSHREIEKRVFRILHHQIKNSKTRVFEIHTHIIRHNLHQSNQILAHLVSICSSSSLNQISYACRVFHATQNPNILLYNSMIKAYSLHGPFLDAVRLFSVMRNRDIWPDQYTFTPLIKACSGMNNVGFGECVHGEVIVSGFEFCGSVRIGMVEFYASCGMMKEAKKVFDEMPKRDVVAWNMMIRGYCKKGDLEMGLCVFRQMEERSVVSWNSMISSLEQGGRDEEALELFREMRDEGFEPDDATIGTVLPVCARLGDVDAGHWIHSYADSKGFFKEFVTVGNAIVDFYCKCGNLDIARKVFNEMPRKNVVSLNAMIAGLAFNGEGALGVELFEEMMSIGRVSPNEATFLGVFACCAHAGLVERGRAFFSSMKEKYQIKPNLEHYGCMVDILGRGGFVKEAYGLILSMLMKPNAALWGALLSACRTYGDVDIAECAVKELIVLEPWNSGNYVLLSNIYAEGGKWDEVEKVRVLMRGKSVKKGQGHSAVIESDQNEKCKQI